MRAIIVILSLGLVSCQQKSKAYKNPTIKVSELISGDTCKNKMRDTLFSNGSFIGFKWDTLEDNYQMIYGNREFFKGTGYFTNCKELDLLYKSRFNIEGYNSNFIILTRSCGSDCRTALLLPLDKNRKQFEINDYLAINSELGLIVYLSSSAFNNLIIIQNINNGKNVSKIINDFTGGGASLINHKDMIFSSSKFKMQYMISDRDSAKFRLLEIDFSALL